MINGPSKIKVKLMLPSYKDLIRYGKIEEDHEFGIDKCIRVLKIRYMGILYQMRMENGNVTCIKQWDNFSYQEDESDLSNMDEHELAEKMMFADRDRKNNPDADRVYWMCVKEVNRRIDCGEIQKFDN